MIVPIVIDVIIFVGIDVIILIKIVYFGYVYTSDGTTASWVFKL